MGPLFFRESRLPLRYMPKSEMASLVAGGLPLMFMMEVSEL